MITFDEIYREIANGDDLSMKCEIAKAVDIPKDVQFTLARASEGVSYSLAQNLNLHPEVQAELALHPSVGIRRTLAGNPNLHPEVQEAIARDGYRRVRQTLAGNPNLTEETRAFLEKYA